MKAVPPGVTVVGDTSSVVVEVGVMVVGATDGEVVVTVSVGVVVSVAVDVVPVVGVVVVVTVSVHSCWI